MRLIDADETKRIVESLTMDVTLPRCNGKGLTKELTRAYRDSVVRAIESAPTFDPERHGEWIKEDKDGFLEIQCSECSNPPLPDYSEEPCLSEFCPNCGAKMDEGDVK